MRGTQTGQLVRIVLGAVIGLLVAVPCYLLVVDWLEGQSGAVREAQGLVWNLLLLGVLLGGVAGGLIHPRKPG